MNNCSKLSICMILLDICIITSLIAYNYYYLDYKDKSCVYTKENHNSQLGLCVTFISCEFNYNDTTGYTLKRDKIAFNPVTYIDHNGYCPYHTDLPGYKLFRDIKEDDIVTYFRKYMMLMVTCS